MKVCLDIANEEINLNNLTFLEAITKHFSLNLCQVKANAKESWSYRTTALISYAGKVMLKILQAWLQQYMTHEIPDVQVGFRKDGGTKDQIANMHWIIKKAREFQKNIYFCFIDYVNALTVWIKTNCGKFWKTWEYQTTWPAFWKTYMHVKKQQLKLDMEQQTGSK